MARLILENIGVEQAEALAHWYEGQGEQDSSIWLEAARLKPVYADVGRKGGCIEVDKDTVILYCRKVES